MQYKIKDLTLASYRAFNGSEKLYDRIENRNNIIIKKLFNDTLSGKIKGFYLLSDKDFKAYHKSTKKPGNIQLSSGFYENGQLIPCYDLQFNSITALYKEGYKSGIYRVIE